MRDIITVAKFTMKEMLKRKSFIISTIILMILIVIGFNVPNIIKIFSGDNSVVQGSKILVLDNENVFEGKLSELNKDEIGCELEVTSSSIDELKEKINNDEIEACIVVERHDNNVMFRYIVNDTMGLMPDSLRDALEKLYTNTQISKLGLSQQEIERITPQFDVNVEQSEDVKGNAIVITILSIILFYAIYFCAFQVSNSITTEKTSKIMETLVTSTSPRTIVIGKTIGIGLVGLIQIFLFVITAVISAKLFLDSQLIGILLSSSQVTPLTAILMLIYFILGYYMFSLIYALTGSTVSKPEDVQSANTPVTIIGIVGLYMSQAIISKPVGSFTTFVCYCPISSPFAMPFRVMMGLASIQEVIISIAILLVTIILIAHIAIRIYSNAILNYGTKLSVKDIVNMYKTK